MGSTASSQRDELREMQQRDGNDFPGCHHRPPHRKDWMYHLNPARLRINEIVWLGTHNSATNNIGDIITRPFAECQTLSIYNQLVMGTRVLDIRVNENRLVCHGGIVNYHIDVAINDIRRFLAETQAEIMILEIRTECGQRDPPEFERYLEERLGEFLIHNDESVFNRTVAQVLPRRVICVWKPRNSPPPRVGGPLWHSEYLRDDWIDIDLPLSKFDGNLSNLSAKPPARTRNYFYRVENTVTARGGWPPSFDWNAREVTGRIHGYARLFISRCFAKQIGDRLQILSTDFINEDFVDACVGLSYARISG